MRDDKYGGYMMMRKPTHPGEVLREDVLNELGITVTRAAECLGVTRKALSEFVNCRSRLSMNMAVRIGKATNTTPDSWVNMQVKLDLWEAKQRVPEVTVFADAIRGNSSTIAHS